MQRLNALLLATMVGSSTGFAQQGPRRYDVYRFGVRTAELSIGGTVSAPVYSIRKKDVASNSWSPVRSAPIASLPADTAFRLWGSLRDLGPSLALLGRVDWKALELVGWPDRNTIYERGRM